MSIEILQDIVKYAGIAAILWNIGSYWLSRQASIQSSRAKTFSDTILKEVVTPHVITPLLQNIEDLIMSIETYQMESIQTSLHNFQTCVESVRRKILILNIIDKKKCDTMIEFMYKYEDKVSECALNSVMNEKELSRVEDIKNTLLSGFTRIVAYFTVITINADVEKVSDNTSCLFAPSRIIGSSSVPS